MKERIDDMHEKRVVALELCKMQVSKLYVVKTLKYTPHHCS